MLRDLLGLSKEPLELEISEAAEKFEEQKRKEMDSAEQKAEAIRSDIIDEFEELETSLEEFDDFEDSKDRQVINDVVDNIISDRLEMIDESSFPEDPEELYDELDEFIENFQSLTQKEAAVLEEAYLQKQISRTVGGLEDQRKRLGEFLESEYSTVINYQKLEQLLNKRENLLDELDDLNGKIKRLEIDELEAEIDNIDGQLSELENSSDWEEYEDLQHEVKQKGSEKNQLISELNTSLNKMERGLKKLIYQARNGDASVGKIKILEKLRDKNTDYILEHPEKTVEAMEEARESLPEDLLNDTQQQKFLEAIDEIEDLPQKSDRIDSLESEVDELEQQVDEHSVIQERDRLESEKNKIQKRLEDERKEKDNLEQKVDELETEVDETETEIRQVLKESFSREIDIEQDVE